MSLSVRVPMKINANGHPRRMCLETMTPAELAIRAAIIAVESVGADPKLTEVVVMLDDARTKLADYVDFSKKECQK